MDINQEEWEARLGSNLSRVCRLCLKTCENVHPIFSSEEADAQTLSHKIMSCAQVKVFEGDGLPTHVCNSCYSQVERSYQFKLLCERSDNKLRGSTVSMAGGLGMEMDDSDEVDMTQLTPEVIIDEGPPSDHQDFQEDESEEEQSRDVYSRIMHSAMSKVEREVASAQAQASTNKKQPVYLKGIPGFVHSNQEMAKLAVAMALHQRSLEEHEKKAKEKQIQCQMHFQMKQQQLISKQKKTEGGTRLESSMVIQSPKSQRCRNGVKAFKCTQCSKSYSYSSALSRHKAVHNPQLRPHFCTLCNKGFTQMEKLLRHRRSHPVDSESILKEMTYDYRLPAYFQPVVPQLPSVIGQITSPVTEKRFKPGQQSCSISMPLPKPGSIEISIKPDIYPYSDYDDEVETIDRDQSDIKERINSSYHNPTSRIKLENSEYNEIEIKEEPPENSLETFNENKVFDKNLRSRRLNPINSEPTLRQNSLDQRDPDSVLPGSPPCAAAQVLSSSSLNHLKQNTLTGGKHSPEPENIEVCIKPDIYPFSDSNFNGERKNDIEKHIGSLSNHNDLSEIKRNTRECEEISTKQEPSESDEKSNDEESHPTGNDNCKQKLTNEDKARINLLLRYQFMK